MGQIEHDEERTAQDIIIGREGEALVACGDLVTESTVNESPAPSPEWFSYTAPETQRRQSCFVEQHFGAVDLSVRPLDAWERDRRYLKEFAEGTFEAFALEGMELTMGVTEDGLWCLASCVSDLEEIELPDTVGGRVIEGVGFSAFSESRHARIIVCPPQAFHLDKRAFEGCRNVVRLVLPRNVEEFDTYCLQSCRNLKELVLPDRLKTIPQGLLRGSALSVLVVGRETEGFTSEAFSSSMLERIEIDPENKNYVTDGKAVFTRDRLRLVVMATKDSAYDVPATCRVVGRKAFSQRIHLERVGLPDELRVIEPMAFVNTHIESFVAPRELRVIGERAFLRCSKLAHVELNDELRLIETEAFCDTAVSSVHIPAKVREIGCRSFLRTNMRYAFAAEEGEEVFCIDAANPYIFEDGKGGLYRRRADGLVFDELLNPSVADYEVLPGTRVISDAAFMAHDNLAHVTLPEGLRAIGQQAFRSVVTLNAVETPSTLESIGDRAFLGSSLVRIHLPAAFCQLGEEVFKTANGFSNPKHATLHELTVDERCARYFCTSGVLFERLTARNGITCYYAIVYGGNETDVVLPFNTTHLSNYLFYDAEGVRSVTIPATVRNVGFGAFSMSKAPRVLHVSQFKDVFDKMVDGFEPTRDLGLMTLEFQGKFTRAQLPVPEDNTALYEAMTATGLSQKVYDDIRSVDGVEEGSVEVVNYDINFPVGFRSTQSLRDAFQSRIVDPNILFEMSDGAVARTASSFSRTKIMLERLSWPVFLLEESRTCYLRALTRDLARTCTDLASHNWTRGFEIMRELGLLNRDNITEAIDYVSNAGDTAMVGYLLELRHRYFGGALMDFDI